MRPVLPLTETRKGHYKKLWANIHNEHIWKKQRKAQINKIVNDRGDITTENINTKDRKKLL